MTRRIGIYTGTFDPVHEGHLAFAETALNACSLDEVWLLPERRPRGKQGVTDVSQRLRWLERATHSRPLLRAMALKDEQFTVRHTLPQLIELSNQAQLILLIGSDVVPTFTYRWDGLGVLLRSVELAIGMRTGDSQDAIELLLDRLALQHGVTIRRAYIRTSHAHVASSQLRTVARLD